MTREPIYFASPEDFRHWLEQNHDSSTELWLGYHKRATGKPTLTWPESVDEALCYGWIDGVRRSLGPDAYTIRFTPRKARSKWSEVNLKRVAALIASGRMHPAGLAAYASAGPATKTHYSYENRDLELSPDRQRRLAANRAAADDLASRPPWYRRAATHWVESARKEETREKRFAELLAASSRGEPIKPLARKKPS